MSATPDPDGHVHGLEAHYRPCACRSSTPFFGERFHADGLAHETDSGGSGYRTKYQHDRDKVLYSYSFRRLRLKSQIFPEHAADHFRTRLDHSLEVAQIARHFARQLSLNEDLVDAIALAHDIGHAPFGHSGERALHTYLKRHAKRVEEEIQKESGTDIPYFDGFRHNWHGLRVVDLLERSYPEHEGLNLTRAVRIGLLRHTELSYGEGSGLHDPDPSDPERGWPGKRCACDFRKRIEEEFDPQHPKCLAFEVQLCALADEIAQLIHEFEDAVLSGQFALEEKVRKGESPAFVKRCLEAISRRVSAASVDVPGWTDWARFDFEDGERRALLLARLRSQMLYELTTAVIDATQDKLEQWEKNVCAGDDASQQVAAFDRFANSGEGFPEIFRLEEGDVADEFKGLKKELGRGVVGSERVNRMDGKAEYIIGHILDIYLKKPKQVHQRVLDSFTKQQPEASDIRQMRESEVDKLRLDRDPIFVRSAVDYVAGMTDRFALREYDQLYSAYPRVEL